MDAREYIIEKMKTDFNTRQLVNQLDALYQEVLLSVMDDYHNSEVKKLDLTLVSNLLCGSFEPDNKTSSATKCKCGREKWEHPKAT